MDDYKKEISNLICVIDELNMKIDFSKRKIYINDESVEIDPKVRGKKAWRFLEVLFEAQGRVVTDNYLLFNANIWDYQDNHSSDRPLTNFKSAFNNNVFNSEVIKRIRGEGYTIAVDYKKFDDVSETFDHILPRCLTKNLPQFAHESNIIHRESETKEIIEMIEAGNCKISITGFGGIGKTSLLGLLFWKIQEKYQHIGWIEYNGDCKQSLLTDLDVLTEIEDSEIRWTTILKMLRNDLSPKILFIDNVDVDNRINQNPLDDTELHTLCEIPNLTVVITSRLEEIVGYASYLIGELGCNDTNEKKIECCSDLFYSYYKKDELKKPSQKRQSNNEVLCLIELAQYHTYLIELLAKGAKCYADLNEYIDLLKENGISFPKAFFQTSYAESYTTVAAQIQKLFSLQTRTEEEIKILWDFAALPDMVLSIEEVKDWLGYDELQWTILKDQGWLLYRNGLMMHPLVKESFRLSSPDGLAPKGTLKQVINLYTDNKFALEDDTFNVMIRKMIIITHINNSVNLDVKTRIKLFLLFEINNLSDIEKSIMVFLDRSIEIKDYRINTLKKAIDRISSEKQECLFLLENSEYLMYDGNLGDLKEMFSKAQVLTDNYLSRSDKNNILNSLSSEELNIAWDDLIDDIISDLKDLGYVD